MASEAFLLVAKSQWAAGEFQTKVMDSVSRASTRLARKEDNVAGVALPIFTIRETNDDDESNQDIGLYGGATTIKKTKEKFKELLKVVVDIASLQTSFVTLDAKIKLTSRRVNALEHVVVPEIESTIKYIKCELEEAEREEKFT